jgi:hypothetical protein
MSTLTEPDTETNTQTGTDIETSTLSETNDETSDATAATASDTLDETDTGMEGLCTPGDIRCFGQIIFKCNEFGTKWVQQEDCQQSHTVCAAGVCQDISLECASAINSNSYIGCEYYATTLANSYLNFQNDGTPRAGSPFFFAVVLANDSSQDAQVRITDGPSGDVDYDYVVKAGDVLTVDNLPWKFEVKEPFTGGPKNEERAYASRLVKNGVYHIKSSHPITAYQFNPLDYKIGDYYSYTNDASLLLPSHVYRSHYIAMTRPTWKTIGTSLGGTSIKPGFLAVLGTEEGITTINVEYTANTYPSDGLSTRPIGGAVPNLKASIAIEPFEVLQILASAPSGCPGQTTCGATGVGCCEVSADYDLTGTQIQVTSGPNPAVFAGADCVFIPFDNFACDHIEQQMFPYESWGFRYACGHHVEQTDKEPSVFRIYSNEDANTITFDPSSVYPTTILGKGDYIELQTTANFIVTGTDKLAVAQFMVSASPHDHGDPAMSLVVPIEQYRKNYSFLAPDSFLKNYITVIHRIGEIPVLDGTPIFGDTVEINGEYARTNLEINGGIHFIESSEYFGLTVYGIGRYTSYMYPGGLDLVKIDAPI